MTSMTLVVAILTGLFVGLASAGKHRHIVRATPEHLLQQQRHDDLASAAKHHPHIMRATAEELQQEEQHDSDLATADEHHIFRETMEQQLEPQERQYMSSGRCVCGGCGEGRCRFDECTEENGVFTCEDLLQWQFPTASETVGSCGKTTGIWTCEDCQKKQGKSQCCKNCIEFDGTTREPTPAPWPTPAPTSTPTMEPTIPPPTAEPTVISESSSRTDGVDVNFLYNFAGVNVDYDVLNVCDEEWGSVVNCVQSSCPYFDQVCSGVGVPSNLPLPTTCDEIETNFCNQYNDDLECCLFDCADMIQDLHVCVTNQFVNQFKNTTWTGCSDAITCP